jgi:hypothetical protein
MVWKRSGSVLLQYNTIILKGLSEDTKVFSQNRLCLGPLAERTTTTQKQIDIGV